MKGESGEKKEEGRRGGGGRLEGKRREKIGGGRGKGEDRETELEEPGAKGKGALCERYKVHSSSLVTEVRFVVH